MTAKPSDSPLLPCLGNMENGQRLFLASRTIEAGTTGEDYPGNLTAAALTPFPTTSVHFELTLEMSLFAAAVHIV